jgi:hypothetical protein
VGFVVDKVALVQVFSEYFGAPCQSIFQQFIHNHHHLSSGAGTVGQQWPQYPKSHRTNYKKKIFKSERFLNEYALKILLPIKVLHSSLRFYNFV